MAVGLIVSQIATARLLPEVSTICRNDQCPFALWPSTRLKMMAFMLTRKQAIEMVAGVL
jgi:hypothetical protein